jgi:hypothetical protein
LDGSWRKFGSVIVSAEISAKGARRWVVHCWIGCKLAHLGYVGCAWKRLGFNCANESCIKRGCRRRRMDPIRQQTHRLSDELVNSSSPMSQSKSAFATGLGGTIDRVSTRSNKVSTGNLEEGFLLDLLERALRFGGI